MCAISQQERELFANLCNEEHVASVYTTRTSAGWHVHFCECAGKVVRRSPSESSAEYYLRVVEAKP